MKNDGFKIIWKPFLTVSSLQCPEKVDVTLLSKAIWSSAPWRRSKATQRLEAPEATAWRSSGLPWTTVICSFNMCSTLFCFLQCHVLLMITWTKLFEESSKNYWNYTEPTPFWCSNWSNPTSRAPKPSHWCLEMSAIESHLPILSCMGHKKATNVNDPTQLGFEMSWERHDHQWYIMVFKSGVSWRIRGDIPNFAMEPFRSMRSRFIGKSERWLPAYCAIFWVLGRQLFQGCLSTTRHAYEPFQESQNCQALYTKAICSWASLLSVGSQQHLVVTGMQYLWSCKLLLDWAKVLKVLHRQRIVHHRTKIWKMISSNPQT